MARDRLSLPAVLSTASWGVVTVFTIGLNAVRRNMGAPVTVVRSCASAQLA